MTLAPASLGRTYSIKGVAAEAQWESTSIIMKVQVVEMTEPHIATAILISHDQKTHTQHSTTMELYKEDLSLYL